MFLAFVNTFNAIVENIDYFMEKWKGQIEGEDILRIVTVKRFIANFQTAQPIEWFDTELYFKLVEKITVNENKLLVCLLYGTEIECEVE